jgi:hypothetical protein
MLIIPGILFISVGVGDGCAAGRGGGVAIGISIGIGDGATVGEVVGILIPGISICVGLDAGVGVEAGIGIFISIGIPLGFGAGCGDCDRLGISICIYLSSGFVFGAFVRSVFADDLALAEDGFDFLEIVFDFVFAFGFALAGVFAFGFDFFGIGIFIPGIPGIPCCAAALDTLAPTVKIAAAIISKKTRRRILIF